MKTPSHLDQGPKLDDDNLQPDSDQQLACLWPCPTIISNPPCDSLQPCVTAGSLLRAPRRCLQACRKGWTMLGAL